jgi:hypothetical protein
MGEDQVIEKKNDDKVKEDLGIWDNNNERYYKELSYALHGVTSSLSFKVTKAVVRAIRVDGSLEEMLELFLEPSDTMLLIGQDYFTSPSSGRDAYYLSKKKKGCLPLACIRDQTSKKSTYDDNEERNIGAVYFMEENFARRGNDILSGHCPIVQFDIFLQTRLLDGLKSFLQQGHSPCITISVRDITTDMPGYQNCTKRWGFSTDSEKTKKIASFDYSVEIFNQNQGTNAPEEEDKRIKLEQRALGLRVFNESVETEVQSGVEGDVATTGNDPLDSSSIDDVLSTVFDEMNNEEESESPKAQAEQPAEEKKSDAATTETPTASKEQASEEQKTPEKDIDAPVSWTKLSKEQFKSLPQEIKAELRKREDDITRGFQELGGYKRSVESMLQAVAPYQARLNSMGVDLPTAVTRLLNYDHVLAYGTSAQKAEAVQSLMASYGLDENTLKVPEPAYVDPEMQELKSRLERTEQQLYQRGQQHNEKEDAHKEAMQNLQCLTVENLNNLSTQINVVSERSKSTASWITFLTLIVLLYMAVALAG